VVLSDLRHQALAKMVDLCMSVCCTVQLAATGAVLVLQLVWFGAPQAV
jgi:hypothetical protein